MMKTVRGLAVQMTLVTLASVAAVTVGVGAAPSAWARQAVAPSIRLNEMDPHLGGTVTFTTIYPKNTPSPRVTVRCYQSGALGYAESGAAGFVFVLGGAGSLWLTNGGPADCTAELWSLVWHGNQQQQVTSLASTSFTAAG